MECNLTGLKEYIGTLKQTKKVSYLCCLAGISLDCQKTLHQTVVKLHGILPPGDWELL